MEHDVQTRQSQLFALIIGINKYSNPEIPPLKGAVTDAMSMETYLRQSSPVTPARIVTLLDENATRDNIVREMLSLANEPVRKNDTILIYFAGHGGRVHKPPNDKNWTEWAPYDNKVELLLPHDVGTIKLRSHFTLSTGIPTQGISNREFQGLLNTVSSAKGDNIVSI